MLLVILLIFISAALVLLYVPTWLNLWRLRLWRQTYHLDRHEPVFKKIYSTVDGFKISKHARIHCDAFEYTYGEIEFTPFVALIALSQPKPDTKFYDLGSGTGKAVLACAMVFDMQQYCGVEIFHELYQSSIQQIEQLKKCAGYEEKALKIKFINQDFLNIDFSEPTLIFINATALFGANWEILNQRLSEHPLGKTVITTSKKLSSKSFTVCYSTQVQMSWGIVNAYIHTSG